MKDLGEICNIVHLLLVNVLTKQRYLLYKLMPGFLIIKDES